MFRDPTYFRALREKVVPLLRTYPSLKVWVAGCSTGEEAYSLAILLREEGLLERTLIYATDINPRALEQAEAGVYAIDRIAGFTENHRRSGARRSLSDYYTAAYGRAVFDKSLRSAHRVLRSQPRHRQRVRRGAAGLLPQRAHLLRSRDLQDRALGLFRDALCRKGFLGLGSKEIAALLDARRRLRRVRPRGAHLPASEAAHDDVADRCARPIDAVVDRRLGRRRRGAVRAAAGAARADRALPSSSCCICRASGRACWPSSSRPKCALPVREAEDKEPVAARHRLLRAARLSPAGRRRPARSRCRPTSPSTTRGRRSTCCSSPPRMSTASASLGVILTGANADGADGLARRATRRRHHDRAGPGDRIRVRDAGRGHGARAGPPRAHARRHRGAAWRLGMTRGGLPCARIASMPRTSLGFAPSQESRPRRRIPLQRCRRTTAARLRNSLFDNAKLRKARKVRDAAVGRYRCESVQQAGCSSRRASPRDTNPASAKEPTA